MKGRLDHQFSEGRQCPRYNCKGAVEIFQSGRRFGWGELNDISRSGCYIGTVQPLAIGSEIQLRVTIADILLEIGGVVVSNTPMVGMGMKFMGVLRGQDNLLAQIIEKVVGIDSSPGAQKATQPRPGNATVQIAREAAPNILAKIVQRINEKGILTRQELVEIVKACK